MFDFPLHHIGVATHGIEKELRVFEGLGYRAASAPFVDEGQKIRGLFITTPGCPTLELLEHTGSSGPLDLWLKKGVKFYHFSYEVPDMEEALGMVLRLERAKVVVPVTTATYFHKICFVMLPNMLLVELVQTTG